MDRYQYLKQFHGISLKDFQLLNDCLKTKNFKKGEYILLPGQVAHELYFVQDGVQMAYYDTGEKTYTLSFSYAPNLCGIAESFSFQIPSKYHLVCLTDSKMEYITYDALQKLIDSSQQIERLFRRMTETMFAGMIDLHIELRASSIEERYKNFCRKSPELLHLVPHKYIASYLGIDHTNFSKLFNNVKF